MTTKQLLLALWRNVKPPLFMKEAMDEKDTEFKRSVCRNCIHFYNFDELLRNGSCKRYPPIYIVDSESGKTFFGFPIVDDDETCGEFESE